MLQLIAHIVIISVTCLLWGIPLLLLIKNKSGSSDYWLDNTAGFYSFLFFGGLINLSFICSWLCLFIPLQFGYLALLSALLCIFLFTKRKRIRSCLSQFPILLKFSITEFLFIGIYLIVFLIAGTLKPSNNDTWIYHIQVIRWFNEYGAVAGIANLSPRFGLGSNWFNLISVFRISFSGHENFTWLNTTTVIWFFIWLLSRWKYHLQKNDSAPAHTIIAHFYFLIILYCFFEWELFRDAANSTNYDFIVTALSIIVIGYLLEIILFAKDNPFSFLVVFLCLSIIPFKLSGIFILLILLFYLSGFKKIKYWLLTIVAGLFILLPFLIKNYITTGYPLYPISWSPSSPDWQVPHGMTDYLRMYIHIAGRFYNTTTVDFTRLPELMDQSWFSSWFHGLLLRQKFILALALTSISILLFKSRLIINYKKIRMLFAVLLLMAAGWFVTAPSPRFGYGILLTLAFFPICFYIGDKLTTKLHKAILIFTIFIAGYYMYQKSRVILSSPGYFLYPQSLEQPPLAIIKKQGMDFYLPEIINNGWMRNCYNTELPCTCNENKYLQPRGKSLKDGFKMEPQPDSIFIRRYVY